MCKILEYSVLVSGVRKCHPPQWFLLLSPSPVCISGDEFTTRAVDTGYRSIVSRRHFWHTLMGNDANLKSVSERVSILERIFCSAETPVMLFNCRADQIMTSKNNKNKQSPIKCASTKFIAHGIFSSQLAEETKRNPENDETLKIFENIDWIRLQENQSCYSVPAPTSDFLCVEGVRSMGGSFRCCFSFLRWSSSLHIRRNSCNLTCKFFATAICFPLLFFCGDLKFGLLKPFQPKYWKSQEVFK